MTSRLKKIFNNNPQKRRERLVKHIAELSTQLPQISDHWYWEKILVEKTLSIDSTLIDEIHELHNRAVQNTSFKDISALVNLLEELHKDLSQMLSNPVISSSKQKQEAAYTNELIVKIKQFISDWTYESQEELQLHLVEQEEVYICAPQYATLLVKQGLFERLLSNSRHVKNAPKGIIAFCVDMINQQDMTAENSLEFLQKFDREEYLLSLSPKLQFLYVQRIFSEHDADKTLERFKPSHSLMPQMFTVLVDVRKFISTHSDQLAFVFKLYKAYTKHNSHVEFRAFSKYIFSFYFLITNNNFTSDYVCDNLTLWTSMTQEKMLFILSTQDLLKILNMSNYHFVLKKLFDENNTTNLQFFIKHSSHINFHSLVSAKILDVIYFKNVDEEMSAEEFNEFIIPMSNLLQKECGFDCTKIEELYDLILKAFYNAYNPHIAHNLLFCKSRAWDKKDWVFFLQALKIIFGTFARLATNDRFLTYNPTFQTIFSQYEHNKISGEELYHFFVKFEKIFGDKAHRYAEFLEDDPQFLSYLEKLDSASIKKYVHTLRQEENFCTVEELSSHGYLTLHCTDFGRGTNLKRAGKEFRTDFAQNIKWCLDHQGQSQLPLSTSVLHKNEPAFTTIGSTGVIISSGYFYEAYEVDVNSVDKGNMSTAQIRTRAFTEKNRDVLKAIRKSKQVGVWNELMVRNWFVGGLWLFDDSENKDAILEQLFAISKEYSHKKFKNSDWTNRKIYDSKKDKWFKRILKKKGQDYTTELEEVKEFSTKRIPVFLVNEKTRALTEVFEKEHAISN